MFSHPVNVHPYKEPFSYFFPCLTHRTHLSYSNSWVGELQIICSKFMQKKKIKLLYRLLLQGRLNTM